MVGQPHFQTRATPANATNSTNIPRCPPNDIPCNVIYLYNSTEKLIDPNYSPATTAFLLIYSNSSWSGSILDSGFDSSTKTDSGDMAFPFACSPGGIYSLSFQNQNEIGFLNLKAVNQGNILDQHSTTAPYGVVSLSGKF
jgi:hypothetical protein